MAIHWFDRPIAWIYTRTHYGRRCRTKDTEDFDDLELRHPDCPHCTCGRCGACVAWDEYDWMYRDAEHWKKLLKRPKA